MVERFEALLVDFELEARERLDRIEQGLLEIPNLSDARQKEAVAAIKRDLHTLKGNAGMMGLTDLQSLAHSMEDQLAADGDPTVADLLANVDSYRAILRSLMDPTAKETANGASIEPSSEAEAAAEQTFASVRVPFSVLDPLIDLIGEMVILRNRMSDSVSAGIRLDAGAADYATRSTDAWSGVHLAQEHLSRTLDDIQGRVMALRMTPLHAVLGSLRRIVHDESTRINKQANLETDGGDTPLDKALLEFASEALGHLVRNAVIHGLEDPESRIAAGKPAAGTVSVQAKAKGNEVLIAVADDGNGIDRDKLGEVARARGVRTDHLSDITEVLFEPGFSTREITDMGSGRGVGLAAVRDSVQRQGGEIEITTSLGRGTTFLLRLPLSVSIARALIVATDGEMYAVPLTAVVESRHLQNGDGHTLNQAGVYRWRNELLTLLDLGQHFRTSTSARTSGYVIVVEAGGKRRGLITDEIVATREVVVKGLDPIIGQPPGVGGSTVLGDGRPILILDPRKLVEIEPFPQEAA